MALIKAMGLTFNYKKYDGLDGKTKAEWATEDNNLVFQADQEKIMLKGTINISTQGELQEFAKFFSDVWVQHQRMAPRILKPGEQ